MPRASGENRGVMAPILISPKCDGKGGMSVPICRNLEDTLAACGVSVNRAPAGSCVMLTAHGSSRALEPVPDGERQGTSALLHQGSRSSLEGLPSSKAGVRGWGRTHP